MFIITLDLIKDFPEGPQHHGSVHNDPHGFVALDNSGQASSCSSNYSLWIGSKTDKYSIRV